MFKTIRIFVLLVILLGVSVSTYLTKARSTDWNNSLYVKIYPINADGSIPAEAYIADLDVDDFAGIEDFMQREIGRYGHTLNRPVRVRLGQRINEQPPEVGNPENLLDVMWWSLRMRWWARSVAGPQDDPAPDVRIFVRYHTPEDALVLDNSVGLQKGMVGVVNAFAHRRYTGMNSVVIAHEFLHTLGATDKYRMADGQPVFPDGIAEPDRQPLYPQRYAEIMGGRIAIADNDSIIPKNLEYTLVGPATAAEIGLR
jgi:hypothetical protein